MAATITEIDVSGSEFSRYDVGNPDKFLKKLSRINIFVGANNSGKSRFLRHIASIKKLKFSCANGLEIVVNAQSKFIAKVTSICANNQLQDAGNVVSQASALPDLSHISEGDNFMQPLTQYINNFKGFNPQSFTPGRYVYSGMNPILNEMQIAADECTASIKPVAAHIPTKYEFTRVYIPTLRGLRTFGQADIYNNRTKSDYFKAAENVQIFTGLELYAEMTKLLLGSVEEREAAVDFQQFLGDTFFEGKQVTLIPRHKQDVLDVKIGDEPQLPIYDLGDGIQSLIIMIFPLFQNRDKDLLLFVEEPELFIHPGLQRTLLRTLLLFPRAQCFLATHSNHFLDLTLDIEQISVFSFRKKFEDSTEKIKTGLTIVENLSSEDERSLVLLGILNSSVFLSNCTIWVEGITDRRYFAHYLNLYQEHLSHDAKAHRKPIPKTFKQDLHYSFVEYAGANITHFSFLDSEQDAIIVDRLCGKLFLITDKDSESNKAKERRHEFLKQKLGNRYYCLNCREVENLLTPEVISNVILTYEGENSVLKPFNISSYRNKPLGAFIESKVVTQPKRRKSSYKAKSGTISDKITFCQRALESIKSFSDLSDEAKSISKRLYDFVASRNN